MELLFSLKTFFVLFRRSAWQLPEGSSLNSFVSAGLSTLEVRYRQPVLHLKLLLRFFEWSFGCHVCHILWCCHVVILMTCACLVQTASVLYISPKTASHSRHSESVCVCVCLLSVQPHSPVDLWLFPPSEALARHRLSPAELPGSQQLTADHPTAPPGPRPRHPTRPCNTHLNVDFKLKCQHYEWSF